MARATPVPRPRKKGEYRIVHGTRSAQSGWQDLAQTQRNAAVAAWEFLTTQPKQRLPKNHPLKGELAPVTHNGTTHDQWQHEVSHGARLWFYVEGDAVVLVQVHTHHPNQTK